MARERYVEYYWEQVVNYVGKRLTTENKKFLKTVLDRCGTLNVLMPGSHLIADREGAVIRNWMRKASDNHWRESDYNDLWEQVVRDVLLKGD